jgi:hypothetical protein
MRSPRQVHPVAVEGRRGERCTVNLHAIVFCCRLGGIFLPKFPIHDRAAVRAMFVRLLGGNVTLYRLCNVVTRRNRPNPFFLSAEHRLAIWLYSAGALDVFRKVNRELWSESVSREVAFFAELLVEAIGSLPPVTFGQTYRGYEHPDLNAFVATHHVGDIVTWPAFTSSTLDASKAYSGNLLFTINPYRATLLGVYAQDPLEGEVLYAPMSRFRVMALERRGDYAVVELDQIP